MGYAENAEWFKKMLPYAERASQGTGLPTSVILSQWALETGYGTSQSAKVANNYGGIKYVGQPQASGSYLAHAKYNTINDFVSDYIRVMSLGYYNNVRSADSVEDTIKALDASPYAEDPKYGDKITAIHKTYGLNAYNGTATAKPSTAIDMSQFTAQAAQLPKEELVKYAGVGLAVALVATMLTK